MSATVTELHPQIATFDDFWKLAVKKVDRALTEMKWDAITGDGLVTKMLDRDANEYVPITLKGTAEEILKGWKAYRATVIDPHTAKRLIEDRFVINPATFLNRGRWKDYL